MREKIKELLPEIEEIKDAGLRDKTYKVYEHALSLGGWKPEDMGRIPFTLLIPDCKISYATHVRGVTGVALEAAKVLERVYGGKIPIKRDHLLAGALCHDVGKLLEYKEEGGKFVKSKSGNYLRHPFSGANLCFEAGMPDEVTHIVAVHAKEGDGGKRSPEAIILHHADFTNFETLH
jgi:putative nucleotidyltransferase with HDIG domain